MPKQKQPIYQINGFLGCSGTQTGFMSGILRSRSSHHVTIPETEFDSLNQPVCYLAAIALPMSPNLIFLEGVGKVYPMFERKDFQERVLTDSSIMVVQDEETGDREQRCFLVINTPRRVLGVIGCFTVPDKMTAKPCGDPLAEGKSVSRQRHCRFFPFRPNANLILA